MGFFGDLLKMFTKQEIELVESYREGDQVHTFVFANNQNIDWTATRRLCTGRSLMLQAVMYRASRLLSGILSKARFSDISIAVRG
ncbi:hypothetical protein [Paenibacillus sp. MMS20-IR301]|uniref:hypothetical protein n=1 Tax=Paenibacillus sp. MMS20-IR301 TaxID=2895946 RepID=UPI0028E94F89|nr:hypothetical protein [Paenibacillus sp. MMS20-IR301]WNS45261.1 hypothetical protein LOS79_08315 [Paenibacillus sp. MMS20-IR301]